MGAPFDAFFEKLARYVYAHPFTGAQIGNPRTIHDRLGERVSVFDFMSKQQKRDWQRRLVGRDMSDAVARAVSAITIGGGVVQFPSGKGYMKTAVETGSLTELRGAGGGTYTTGGSTHLVSDSAGGHMFTSTGKTHTKYRGLFLQNTNASATGKAIAASNTTHGRVRDVVTLGFATGIELATGGGTCFGWNVTKSEIFGKTLALDAQAQSNSLTLQHTTFGSSAALAIPVRVMDSNSFTMNACDIEGQNYLSCVDIDATGALRVGADISGNHFELAGTPSVATIRLGATAKVSGITIGGNLFTGSNRTVEPLNASTFTNAGGNVVSGASAGDPLLSNVGAMSDLTGIALAAMGNTNTTGVGTSFAFAQRNAADLWKVMAEIVHSAVGVVDGAETGSLLMRTLMGGVNTNLLTLQFVGGNTVMTIGNGGPSVRYGSGTPEGAVTGSTGDIFMNLSGGASTTLYVKTSGSSTNTGWSAK